jgi:hypothetical protein
LLAREVVCDAGGERASGRPVELEPGWRAAFERLRVIE